MSDFPKVVRSDEFHPPVLHPDRVVKKDWGVECIMNDGHKVSYPWEQIQCVKEQYADLEIETASDRMEP